MSTSRVLRVEGLQAENSYMKIIRDACLEAKISLPPEVEEYYQDSKYPAFPTEEGGIISVPLQKKRSDDSSIMTGTDASYYLLDLEQIPKEVKRLRIYIEEF